ncbi:TPA: inosine/xanthosine triphosphatase [Candidatus Woesearchaeota archaeon]|nr:inosine/xanthosine triphosphatase [archaeon]HIJ11758.1 inosine/xanthosine triphosphatase [Candidatus Woesearchaeota archaeon]|tara:strand:+ start:897 stop:1433 length:537 start_codon:yes stop_codon:yes gene_type:complete
MKITVGSLNQIKVNAVVELCSEYEILIGANVSGVSVDSGVSEQPQGFDETIQGACNRAKSAFNGCLGVGIEGGLVSVTYGERERFSKVSVAALYDGTHFYVGMSSLFELPHSVKVQIEKGETLSKAMHSVQLVGDADLGSREGAIGFLTKGRVPRKEQAKQALRMAMIHIENNKIYRN